jgi:hypothetical protein
MTAEEKAKQWLTASAYSFDDEMINNLAILLKQQDRDTRHACAEAVIALPTIPMTESLINKDAAHNTIMNTRAI